MEKLTREEIEMCEIAVGQVIDRLDLTPENKAKWEALFDRLEALQRETCLTQDAPDGDKRRLTGRNGKPTNVLADGTLDPAPPVI